jgi:glycosyltransferase involved in cell wall biosynthesis
MAAGRLPLSACIITKDEEDRLPRCLESVSFCEDVVVLDSGSTDSTLKVAESLGARVFLEQWRGFGPQKQRAMELARFDTVLMLDADEVLEDEARGEIAAVLEAPEASAYSFRRRGYIGGRLIRHSGWWPDRVVRLVDRRQCRMEGNIHERVIVDGNTGQLDSVIHHYSFRDYSHMIKKMDVYSDYTSDKLLQEGRSAGPLSPLTHSISMFLRTYILKAGALDGLDGLVISLLNAGGTFFKYAKLLEKKRRPRDEG